MSSAYKTCPMPHVLDITCPLCSGLARFEFGEVVRIRERKDIPFFQTSNQFEYQMFTDSRGQRWHGAIYYAGLHGGSVNVIRDLPDGYSSSDWEHSKYLRWGSYYSFGAYACLSCHAVHRHNLDWPKDAYFQITYRGEALWAFHREAAVCLRDYVASKLRVPESHKWTRMLLHVPTTFLVQNARATVTKRLDQALLGIYQRKPSKARA
jgi:hypothetical protein